MTQNAFMRAFLGALVERGRLSIRPQHSDDRAGFFRVISALELMIEEIKASDDKRDLYKQLVRLRNGLQPSNNGSFDNFETALRDLQTSVTVCPNPFYEFISIQMSEPLARKTLNDLPATHKMIVENAANAFVGSHLGE